MSESAIYLRGTKFTTLIGDRRVFDEAQRLADAFESHGIIECIESATFEWDKFHIRVLKNREKVMRVVCSILSDAEITCIEV